MTPTAMACRKASTEQGRVYIHTDVYLEYRKELAPGTSVVVRTGMTVSIPKDLLDDLGSYGFKYWLDWVTAALLENEVLELPSIERFYRAIGYTKETP